MAETTGQVTLRAENIDNLIKGFVQMELKMKQLCMESTSNAWIESYFRETAGDLTGGAGAAIKGVPRLADFPAVEVSWTKVSAYIEKYSCQGVISYEDELTGNVDQIARSLLKIARAVAYAVDSQIYSVLAANAGNTITISNGYEWDAAVLANRDPIKDLLLGKVEIEKDNFDADVNGHLVVNPHDCAYLMANSKVINSPTFKGADIVQNGKIGKLVNLTIVKTNACSASGALIVIAKEAATWKSAQGLKTMVIDDPGIKKTIRSFELGVCFVPAPNAICKIVNTAVTV